MQSSALNSVRESIESMIRQAKGCGGILTYSDYQVIETWIEQYQSPDDLICMLADLLPKYYEKNRKKGLRQLAKKIDKLQNANSLLRQ